LVTAGKLDIEVSYKGDSMTVAIAGDLDLGTCPRMRSLFDCVDWESITRFTIDLRRVDFIDSSGLHELLRVRRNAASNAVSLGVIPGLQRVQRVFELTGIESQFTWIKTSNRGRVRRHLVAPSTAPEPSQTIWS
jgi:anti-sigma B factor antagonist